MKYVFWLALFAYGFFFHISSSEFWPVTISKTWFVGSFESSMLQKPLFTFFLSLVHFIPLTDSAHLYLVRAFFCILGLCSLILYSQLLNQINHKNRPNFNGLIPLAFVILSPTLLHNFFNIRSDQTALLAFMLFIIFLIKKRPFISFLAMLSIPLLGIKETIFIIPAVFLYFKEFSHLLRRKQIYYLMATMAAIFIWIIALNIPGLMYFMQNLKHAESFKSITTDYLKYEFLLLLFSFFAAVYCVLKNIYRTYAFLSLYFSLLIFTMPQAFSFFIASVLPFVYLPLFLIVIKYIRTHTLKVMAVITAQVLWVGWQLAFGSLDIYRSNIAQFNFIEKTSVLLQKQNYTYLDGMGIFPRQRLTPCFASPNDEASNGNCVEKLERATADIVIITHRLFSLGQIVFTETERNYTQIRPNVWVRQNNLNSDVKKDIDLQINQNQSLPLLLFN
jgi:hypothetical protein